MPNTLWLVSLLLLSTHTDTHTHTSSLCISGLCVCPLCSDVMIWRTLKTFRNEPVISSRLLETEASFQIKCAVRNRKRFKCVNRNSVTITTSDQMCKRSCILFSPLTSVNTLRSRQASEVRRGLQQIGCIYIMCLFVRQLLNVHAAKTEVENTCVTSAKLFYSGCFFQGSETLTRIIECGISHKPLLHWEEIPRMHHLLTASGLSKVLCCLSFPPLH